MTKKTNLRAFQTSKVTRDVVIQLGQEFGSYGSAFHAAGRNLAKSFLEKHWLNDSDAIPIVYLYRHALELYLKGIILAGNHLMEQAGKGLTATQIQKLLNRSHGGHGLLHLVPFVQKVCQFVGWVDIPEDYAPIKTFDDIRALVADIDKVDPGSFTFRYPTGKDFAELPLKDLSIRIDNSNGHYPFSLHHFVDVMEPLMQLLGGAISGLEEYRDYEDEQDY